ncbi:hypothetical protein APR04_002510 [Promicromonospora umidemergens]|uniref:ABC-type transport system involved in multi-copper enzyme maturation permease subunit n=1 Tax=Promicromonospora umidemergens TaxID=629679 RepID=A0ABP8WTE2_9MICO|nr:hypothetical protein [Promicromonospora umidemergens]MCP2283602.1 hypothetical protein [Promicromonospora umidemergens]
MTTPTIEETTMSRIELDRAAYRRGVAAVGRKLSRTGAVVGIWFWAVYALYAVGISVGHAVTGGDLAISALDTTLGAARWTMIWLGTVVPIALLVLHLAAGGSRRSLFGGVVRGALVVGAGFGVVTTLALLGERLLSESLGMTWNRLGGLPFESPVEVLGTAVAEAFVITTYILYGACIGAGFLRAGAWGTLLIVPLGIPAVLVDLATRTGVVGTLANVELRPDIEHAVVPMSEGLMTTLLGVGGGALAVALAAVALYALLRAVPVRSA